MKLIIAITNKDDEKNVLEGLSENKISATKFEAEGAFLGKKNAVLLIGTEDTKTNEVVSLIKECCSSKKEPVSIPAPQITDPGELLIPESESVKTSGAIIFIVNAEDIIKV